MFYFFLFWRASALSNRALINRMTHTSATTIRRMCPTKTRYRAPAGESSSLRVVTVPLPKIGDAGAIWVLGVNAWCINLTCSFQFVFHRLRVTAATSDQSLSLDKSCSSRNDGLAQSREKFTWSVSLAVHLSRPLFSRLRVWHVCCYVRYRRNDISAW